MADAGSVLLAPQDDGTFRLTLKESGGGRLRATHIWPTTKLVTLCGRMASFEKYEEMPPEAEMTEIGFLISPMLWPIWADREDLQLLDVRHSTKEGRGLKALRNGLRVCFGDVSSEDQKPLESFLVEVQSTIGAIKADESAMDMLLRELKVKSEKPERILLRLYGDKKYGAGSVSSKNFVDGGMSIDPALPPRLQKLQQKMKDDGPAPKKPRLDAEPRPQLAGDEFWCQACSKKLKKTDGEAHKKSSEHIANKAKKKRN
jgi:hypothetical protein